jgi:hypothetical protein
MLSSAARTPLPGATVRAAICLHVFMGGHARKGIRPAASPAWWIVRGAIDTWDISQVNPHNS